uniref:Uncharacterized protein n=1 Tax=Arion vulgaris TaxID=1028688 RepID=A0A0B7BC27_9EUPU
MGYSVGSYLRNPGSIPGKAEEYFFLSEHKEKNHNLKSFAVIALAMRSLNFKAHPPRPTPP